MQPFKQFSSKTVTLPVDNIDTDQIIPARFLKVTDKKGLGAHAFADWRYNDQGQPKPDFVLNSNAAKGAQVLVAGDNFGCGSSREHAPWALVDFGFKAVISTSIADIFRNNALKNGLLPIVVDKTFHSYLMEQAGQEVQIDLEANTITCGETSRSFEVERFARYCLLNGLDQLEYLLKSQNEIQAYEEAWA